MPERRWRTANRPQTNTASPEGGTPGVSSMFNSLGVKVPRTA
jgi:hypothetical protein